MYVKEPISEMHDPAQLKLAHISKRFELSQSEQLQFLFEPSSIQTNWFT